MSTRAVLARPRGSDPLIFEGVYLHNAGGPSEMGPVLWVLMRDRYHFDAAGFSREMIDDNLEGWSNIDCLGGKLAKTWDGKTKITVDQHQDNFNNDREDPGPTSFKGDPTRAIAGIHAPPITSESDAWGAVFAYVVASDGLYMFVIAERGWTPAGMASWKGDEPDWDALDDAEKDSSAAGEAFRKAFEQSQSGDIQGAQTTLLAFIDGGGAKTPEILANLLFTYSRHIGDERRLDKLLDETLALAMSDDDYLMSALVENLCIVLNNRNRGDDSVRLVDHAIAEHTFLDVGCYTGMTYGAFISQDKDLMRNAIAHVEEIMSEEPEVLEEQPAVFDNTAALYLALGDRQNTLKYVALCKEHDYENFDAMPTMDDYAAIKDDPAFKKMFVRA